jgi:hypothetical protein
MIITAKFASTCLCCSAPIAVGNKVEWSKGSKATHVACAGKPAAASVRTAAPRSARFYGGSGARRPGRCWECGAGPTVNADGECGYC